MSLSKLLVTVEAVKLGPRCSGLLITIRMEMSFTKSHGHIHKYLSNQFYLLEIFIYCMNDDSIYFDLKLLNIFSRKELDFNKIKNGAAHVRLR